MLRRRATVINVSHVTETMIIFQTTMRNKWAIPSFVWQMAVTTAMLESRLEMLSRVPCWPVSTPNKFADFSTDFSSNSQEQQTHGNGIHNQSALTRLNTNATFPLKFTVYYVTLHIGKLLVISWSPRIKGQQMQFSRANTFPWPFPDFSSILCTVIIPLSFPHFQSEYIYT